ncbi:MAG: DciA family protein [bacterium]
MSIDDSGDDVGRTEQPVPPAEEPGQAPPVDLAEQALARARSMVRGRATDGGAGGSGRGPAARRRAAATRGDRTTWAGARPDPERDPQTLRVVAAALFAERGWQRPITEARVFTDWAVLVGSDLAAHCQPVGLREGELRVSAGSTAWATQIRLLAPAVLARLNTQLGAGVVTRLTVSGPTGPSWKHGYRSVPGARGPRDTYG